MRGDSTEDEFIELVGVDALSVRSREHQTGGVLSAGSEAPQQFQDDFRGCHPAVRFPRLWWSNPPFPFTDAVGYLCHRNRFVDYQFFVRPVDIGVLEGQDFIPSKTGELINKDHVASPANLLSGIDQGRMTLPYSDCS